MLNILIAAAVFTGYFVESVFGFGGTILSLVAVSSLVDIKDAIFIVTYASICASACVLVSGYRSFSFRHLYRIYLFALPGTIVGTFLLTMMTSGLLLKVFAIFLIAYAIYSFVNPRLQLPYIISRCILFFSGILQGIYATGGPFVLMGYGHEFRDKSTLRSVMAGFFLFGNLLRLAQLQIMGELNTDIFIQYWWLIVPIGMAVGAGFVVHLKIDDRLFKYGVLALLLVAGVFYLLK